MADQSYFGDRENYKSMEELHRAVLEKEAQIPEEGNERGPWWMYVTIFLVLGFGFFYLGRYYGEISDRPHVLFSEAPDETVVTEIDPMTAGRQVYTRVCQSCHQQDGSGVRGAFPSLVGSEWVTGDPARPVNVVLHGMRGEIVRDGVTYNASMPGFGRLLSDQDVAHLITYIRNAFGNEAGEVSPEQVGNMRQATAGRTEAWTESELNSFLEL